MNTSPFPPWCSVGLQFNAQSELTNQERRVRGTMAGILLLSMEPRQMRGSQVLIDILLWHLSAPGAVYINAGDVFVLGTTSFVNNTAQMDGGE